MVLAKPASQQKISQIDNYKIHMTKVQEKLGDSSLLRINKCFAYCQITGHSGAVTFSIGKILPRYREHFALVCWCACRKLKATLLLS